MRGVERWGLRSDKPIFRVVGGSSLPIRGNSVLCHYYKKYKRSSEDLKYVKAFKWLRSVFTKYLAVNCCFL